MLIEKLESDVPPARLAAMDVFVSEQWNEPENDARILLWFYTDPLSGRV